MDVAGVGARARGAERAEPPLLAAWRSPVGKKAVMAVTGVLMILFVVFHVAANLLVFGGKSAVNGLAARLDALGPLLWLARAVLLGAAVLHVVAAVQLSAAAAAARPVAYGERVPQVSPLSSRTIRASGAVLLAFLVFHVLHLASGTLQPAPFTPGDVHGNVVGGFRLGWVAAVYLASLAALGLHLHHGAWSAARSLGLARPGSSPRRRPVALVLAVLLWAGFSAIPLAVLFGWLA